MIFSKKLSKRKILWGLCALLFAGAMMSCVVDDKDDDKDDEPPAIDNPVQTTPEISSVTVSGATEIEATKSSELTATPTFTVAPTDSSSVTYEWEITGGANYASLSATSSATVTLTGKNTTGSEQTVTVKVTATYRGKSVSKTHNVTIAAPGVPVSDALTGLTITAAADSISATGTVNLTATATYTGNPSISFTWEITSGTDYASLESTTGRAAQTVTKSNTLTGKNTMETEQTVTVKVTASDGANEETATCTVTVGAKFVVPEVTKITVYSGISGSSKKDEYDSVAAALAACGSSGDFRIVLPAGTYAENGLTYNGSGTIRITGSGSAKHGTDVVIKGHGSTMPVDNGSSAQNARELLLFKGTGNLILENLTLESDWLRSEHEGVSAMQAEVLGFNASGYVAAYNCSFKSHQDTVRTVGKGWFYDCYIEGDVDFIWMEAGGKVALYEKCEIVSVYDEEASNHSTYIAAPKINLGNTAGKGVVVFNSSIKAPSKQKTYLFRNPWSGNPNNQYNQAAFVKCTIDGTLESALSSSDANGTTDQQYIGWKVDADIASKYTSKASKIGTLSADTEEKEYSGRRAILNRNYIVDSARFEKDTASNWDIDSFINTVGWSVDADPSKDYYDGEEISVVTVWDFTKYASGEINIQSKTGTVSATSGEGTLEVDATSGKLQSRGSDAQFNSGTKIYIPASEGEKISVVGHKGAYKLGATTASAAATDITVSSADLTTYNGKSTVLLEATDSEYLYSITVTGAGSSAGGESGGSGGSESGGESGGSGGSGSGGTGGTTPAPEGNVIKASDIPLGFAGVNSGFASIGATSYSKGSYSNPVTTRADLVKAVSAGGIIYISGMIDMSDEGSGSKLPAVGANNTDVSSVMDSWISSKTSGKYTTYKDWISAYSGAVGKSTDDKKLGNSGNSALASTLWTLNNAWKSVIQLNIKSNTILIGLGSNSGIRGGTISINGVSNVAIRNLYLVDAIDMFPHHETNDGYNSQFDCITVQGTGVKNIWIDHCTFEDTMVMQHVTNGLDSSDEKWQNYDGSCDIKGDAAGVTVSNCHFFKHDKTMLIGSDDKEGNNTVRKISLINNYFDSCVQRLPMVRNSQIHILNNYYEFDKQYTVGDGKTKMSYGIGVRNGSLVYSEANYFGSNMNYPYDGDSKTKSTSKIYIKGDVAAKSGSGNYTVLSSAPFTPSYSYSAKTADDAKAYVLENAGHGKWTVQQ